MPSFMDCHRSDRLVTTKYANQRREVGLVHMNGRIYDPLLGRFLSADRFVQAPDNLQSYNRYSYVMNNPLTLTDPTGDFGIFGGAIGAVIGGAIGGGIAAWQGKSGKEIAAAALGGAVTGGLIGSGAGLVAAALNTGAITGGTAVLASMGVGAVASASGNVTTQVGTNMANSQSFTEAATNIDGASVATSAAVGAAVGVVGGGATVLTNAVRVSTAEIQATMASNINTISTELTAQGASTATISQVQNQIVQGMANTGAATARAVGVAGGNGGVTGVAMEVICDVAGAADAVLNTATPPNSAQTNQPTDPQENQPPVAPPPPVDEEELRRRQGR